MVYPNLEAEIARRGIKKKDIAEELGISYKAFSNKRLGNSPFTYDEVCMICNCFFPDLDERYLFQKERET